MGRRDDIAMPWHTARQRSIEVVIDQVAELAGGALYARHDGGRVIVLAPGLSYAEERSALAHELVHDELGVVSPPATEAMMQRIEAMVRKRAVEWLVPLDQLEELVLALAPIEPITVELVADEWDVTPEVAADALRMLSAQCARGGRRACRLLDPPAEEACS